MYNNIHTTFLSHFYVYEYLLLLDIHYHNETKSSITISTAVEQYSNTTYKITIMFDEEQAVVELSAKGKGDNSEQSETNGDDGFRISNSNINSNIKSNSNDIKRYTEIPKGSFDINRIGNAIAIWTLILVWFWISMYWILVYVPFPPMGGGSEDNVFAYSDYVVKPIAEKVRPFIQ